MPEQFFIADTGKTTFSSGLSCIRILFWVAITGTAAIGAAILSREAVLPWETILSREAVLPWKTVLSREAVLPWETILSREAVLPWETVLSREAVLSWETVLSREAVLSGKTVLFRGAVIWAAADSYYWAVKFITIIFIPVFELRIIFFPWSEIVGHGYTS
ncbi:hypothetical protein [Anaerospora hongkongensis]|uniref:hypothetical protein n=1 Tax=Anaerospora hongkongensis TaxID=244830 RepID=UPI002897AFF9|nr:hypothetical protein [Anaerospora hongkongensis]